MTVTVGLQLLDENQTADFLGVKRQTLATWRCNGRYSLPFVKVGRSIRYRMSDIEKFLESRTVNSAAN